MAWDVMVVVMVTGNGMGRDGGCDDNIRSVGGNMNTSNRDSAQYLPGSVLLPLNPASPTYDSMMPKGLSQKPAVKRRTSTCG
jgi:hypothetical protein